VIGSVTKRPQKVAEKETGGSRYAFTDSDCTAVIAR